MKNYNRRELINGIVQLLLSAFCLIRFSVQEQLYLSAGLAISSHIFITNLRIRRTSK